MPNINECGVKVVYPLDVQCSVVNPTTPTSADGSATLIISGGTPPYTIMWDNGNLTNSIHNLMGGEYSASVTDYYGDFTINTTCVLTQPQPTTTTTTTTTTAQPTYTLCMNISIIGEGRTTFVQIPFNPNGLYLGYQSWLSEDLQYKLYWEQSITSWKLSGSTMNVVSPDPSYPPLNGWQLLGGFGTVSVNEGICVPRPVTSFTFTKTNPTCTCDGGIVIQATGTDTPFQYSINNGLNWFNSPIFTNLCGGVYPLAVKDSLGNIYRDSALLNDVIPTTTYTVTPNFTTDQTSTSYDLSYGITVTPPLPIGVTITFDLTLSDVFTRTPYSGSAINNLSYSLVKSTSVNVIPENTTTTEESTTPNTNGRCEGSLVYTTTTNKVWNNLTLNSGESYQLVASDVITPNCSYRPFINQQLSNDVRSTFIGVTDICCESEVYSTPTITNVRIDGCECCNTTIGWSYTYGRK